MKINKNLRASLSEIVNEIQKETGEKINDKLFSDVFNAYCIIDEIKEQYKFLVSDNEKDDLAETMADIAQSVNK